MPSSAGTYGSLLSGVGRADRGSMLLGPGIFTARREGLIISWGLCSVPILFMTARPVALVSRGSG